MLEKKRRDRKPSAKALALCSVEVSETRRTIGEASNESNASDGHGSVAVRIAPRVQSRPDQAHEERNETSNEEEVADPVELLDLLHE